MPARTKVFFSSSFEREWLLNSINLDYGNEWRF